MTRLRLSFTVAAALGSSHALAQATAAHRVPDTMEARVQACATCHNVRAARVATPILDGLPEPYLRAQLQAFRAGRRANDINEQMGNAARQLTESEIDILSRYYTPR